MVVVLISQNLSEVLYIKKREKGGNKIYEV